MTQLVKKSRDESQKFVFNFPIDITFKSTNPYGCKYIVNYEEIFLMCCLDR